MTKEEKELELNLNKIKNIISQFVEIQVDKNKKRRNIIDINTKKIGSLKIENTNNSVLIKGNKLGLIFLLHKLMDLINGNDDVYGDHFHLDDINGGDVGSVELIIEKNNDL